MDFLLSRNPAKADYPTRVGEDKASSTWFKFGYPLGYSTDVLQNVEVMARLGLAQDPRLADALALILKKQDSRGRWMMENNPQLTSKTWMDIEAKKMPSKWITLRAMRVLKAAYP